MQEIIVIRTSDPDGSIFRSILKALQGKDVQILHAADLEASAPSALTLGDIQIFPEQRRVTKAGVEICLNYGEFSILYCMARCPGRVLSHYRKGENHENKKSHNSRGGAWNPIPGGIKNKLQTLPKL